MPDSQVTVTDFEIAAKVGALISRSYAPELLRLLATYRDISASEAATRLELHIKTAQDFLDELSATGIANKNEAGERKRPYFRYSLKVSSVRLTIDLNVLSNTVPFESRRKWRIRERRNSGTLFKQGRNGKITTVHMFSGQGRTRKERRLSVTRCQGEFLYYLPFPTQEPKAVGQICADSGVGDNCLPEIADLLDTLLAAGAIERTE